MSRGRGVLGGVLDFTCREESVCGSKCSQDGLTRQRQGGHRRI